jgi:hypothetical protein
METNQDGELWLQKKLSVKTSNTITDDSNQSIPETHLV